MAGRGGVALATVRWGIEQLRPLLAIEPVSRHADAVERLRIADGTLIPGRDQKPQPPHATTASRCACRWPSTPTPSSRSPRVNRCPGAHLMRKRGKDSGPAGPCECVALLADGACIKASLLSRVRRRLGTWRPGAAVRSPVRPRPESAPRRVGKERGRLLLGGEGRSLRGLAALPAGRGAGGYGATGGTAAVGADTRTGPRRGGRPVSEAAAHRATLPRRRGTSLRSTQHPEGTPVIPVTPPGRRRDGGRRLVRGPRAP
jgi:hypothetical protein